MPSDKLAEMQNEIAELKHINRNWQISEAQLLAEIEGLKAKTLTDEDLIGRIEFLKSHGASERFFQVYEEAVKWAMGAILRKAQER